jgi:Uma2 family endonuclease
MNERPDIRMDKAQFLQWVQGKEGKYELRRGRVVMQAGSSNRHGWIAAGFVTALSNRLDAGVCAVGPADIAVEVGDEIRYPDVVVEKREDDGSDLSTNRPVILVEVLSPSSAGTDFTEKLAEYTSLPSLEAYIVASQDEPICWLWQRGADGAFPRLPEEIKGRDAAIALSARAISLPLAEIYRGIGATRAPVP